MRSQTQTDEHLIEQYLCGERGSAEAAFETMVRRHGPMVLGVCRQVLNHRQDAEDAFQATFLLLARNAASIKNRKLLGCWLYEVSFRTALRARNRMARRRFLPHTRDVQAPPGDAERDVAWDELRPLLHNELNQLPAQYAVPLTLCYLEGETNLEAARLLRWPVGTLKGRLHRARDMLKERLARLGLDLDWTGFLQRESPSRPSFLRVS